MKQTRSQTIKSFISFIFVSLLLVPYQNCSDSSGTILGNPLSEEKNGTTLFYDAYDESSSSNKIRAKSGTVTPFTVIPGLEIYICLKKTVFHQYTGPTKQMFDIGLGEVELQSFGTELGTYDLRYDIYKKVQLRLRSDFELCPDNVTIRVVNSNGEFKTQSWFRVNYDDLRQVIDGPGQSIRIEVNTIVQALKDVSSNAEIDRALLGTGIATYW